MSHVTNAAMRRVGEACKQYSTIHLIGFMSLWAFIFGFSATMVAINYGSYSCPNISGVNCSLDEHTRAVYESERVGTGYELIETGRVGLGTGA